MAEGLQIEIVSPEHLVLSETVEAVTVPGTEGYFTVMENHAPFMSTLRPGFVTVDHGQRAEVFFVRGGFADVSREGLTILAEEASSFEEFSRSELEEQIKQAREELQRAESHEERTFAQQMMDALVNLLQEADLHDVHRN